MTLMNPMLFRYEAAICVGPAHLKEAAISLGDSGMVTLRVSVALY